MASVELKGVKKIYDNDVEAVKSASLSVKDTEFIVLVGPSGCGKSTLLRMIAGLEDITEGTIEINNKLVNNVSPKDRNIAMVFQNYALYPHMTVKENMSFGLKLRKMPRREIELRVQNGAEILNINDYLDRKPRALSGGQRQRVAVGRAIVRQPDVFLFDEPLSNLDAKLRVQMRIEITKLHQQLNATMIYVTHDQVEAMTMGDRIVVMNNGIIQQVDTPLNIYNNPVNLFVASFIGSPAMNFVKGKFSDTNEFTFISENFSLDLSAKRFEDLRGFTGKETTLGVRPEHLSLNSESTEKTDLIPCTVEVIEPMGNEIIAYFKSANDTITVRCNANSKLILNELVLLNVDLDHIHLFDQDSGNTII